MYPNWFTQTKGEETFITTTGTTHDNKWSQNPYKNELYKKAPGHWNQQMYVKDLREKLMHRPHRTTLTVMYVLLCIIIYIDIVAYVYYTLCNVVNGT